MIQTTFRKRCTNVDSATKLICIGEMVSTGLVYISYPAQYAHRCELCGLFDSYPKCYPHTLIEAQDHEKKEEWS